MNSGPPLVANPPADREATGIMPTARGTAGVLFRNVDTRGMAARHYRGPVRISAASIPATVTTPRGWEVRTARRAVSAG